MIAMLGMYDLPPMHAANDRFWAAIRGHLGYGPGRLSRDADFWDMWRDPDLILAQTCGMPYRTRLHAHVQLVGTPDYGIEGCDPGFYCSVMIARADDPRGLHDMNGARFAYNEALSQSGWSAPVLHLKARGLAPGPLLETGGHAFSAAAVARGDADLAGIDVLTWTLLCEHDSDLTDRLRVVERTDPSPGLPFITAPRQDAAAVAKAVQAEIGDLSVADRDMLHLRGLVRIDTDRYVAQPSPPAP